MYDFFIFSFEYHKEMNTYWRDNNGNLTHITSTHKTLPKRYYECFFTHYKKEPIDYTLQFFNKTYEYKKDRTITKHIYSNFEIHIKGNFYKKYETCNTTEKDIKFEETEEEIHFKKNGESKVSTHFPKKIEFYKTIKSKNVFKCCDYDDVFELKKIIRQQDKKKTIVKFKRNIDGSIFECDVKNECELDEIKEKYDCEEIEKKIKYPNISETDFVYLHYIFMIYPITTKIINTDVYGDYFITNKVDDLSMYMEDNKEYKILTLRFFVDDTFLEENTEDFRIFFSMKQKLN